MQGEQVRKKLLSSGYIMKDIAESMNETPQNFNMLLHAKDIKTGTLERICLAINKTIDFFYTEDERLAPRVDTSDFGKVVRLETYEKKVEECALLKAKLDELLNTREDG